MKTVPILVVFLFSAFGLNAQIITTFCGDGVMSYAGDGSPAIDAQVQLPLSICGDTMGNYFFVDGLNSAVRKISAGTTLVYTIAGGASAGYSGDGGPAIDAYLNQPSAVAADWQGNVFVADMGNNVVRKIDPSGIITTVAGDGTSGYAGDGSAATGAKLSTPMGIAVDSLGNVYIADSYNHRIRKVSTSGVISTVAGNGGAGFSGDGGPATAAKLDQPTAVGMGVNGYLYIADYNNRRIRRLNTNDGTIVTIAGTGVSGNSGNGGPATGAKFAQPIGVSADRFGNIFVADQLSSVVRVINTATGIISAYAGNGSAGFSGDGSSATAAQLNYPTSAWPSHNGKEVIITDKLNSRIRKVAEPVKVFDADVHTRCVSVGPNPATAHINVILSGKDIIKAIHVSTVLGEQLYAIVEGNGDRFVVDVSHCKSGIYIVTIEFAGSTQAERYLIEKI